MSDEELIINLEKVSANLNFMLLDDTFDATKEERTSEIIETNLHLRSCIDSLKLRLLTIECMCNCDICGKQYEEIKPAENFGEFNICPECVDKTDTWLD